VTSVNVGKIVQLVFPCAACRGFVHILQAGEGSIAALSTGGAVSKFGFPLQVSMGSMCLQPGLPGSRLTRAAQAACSQLVALLPRAVLPTAFFAVQPVCHGDSCHRCT